MDKLIVPNNRLVNGERVSKPVEKKLNEIVDWINAHEEAKSKVPPLIKKCGAGTKENKE